MEYPKNEQYTETAVAPFSVGDVHLYTTRMIREESSPFAVRTKLDTPADAADAFRPLFKDKDREEFVVGLLNTAHILTGFSVISIGGLAASIVEPRQVFKIAILANAHAIIFAHNHPSGTLDPSSADISITRQLVKAGGIMGVNVLDHLIITEAGFTSFQERGLM